MKKDPNVNHNGKSVSPLNVALSRVAHDKRQDIADQCLRALLVRCEADTSRGSKFIDGGYHDLGVKMIVMDYLLWCRRFERYATKTLFKEVTSKMNAMIPLIEETLVDQEC